MNEWLLQVSIHQRSQEDSLHEKYRGYILYKFLLTFKVFSSTLEFQWKVSYGDKSSNMIKTNCSLNFSHTSNKMSNFTAN